ncbi:hypothetical protein [Sphingomonas immobilis]|uniref:Uncharacterized protein n=1 Tax=Sphingomonas immobilis TaxID=3063997 RepID=A0ABT8ZY35_9SPHN|nr:hypothetical protein [Sphingomonas sp. CA1-15]MDO7842490.1 hypothetical protein [Sphingomonas sp. CA1-15]
MVASPRQRLILPLAPLGAGVCGVFVALAFLLMPISVLESLVLDSGIPAILDVAQPPLHATARFVLALGGGAAVAGIAWFGLFVTFGARQIVLSPERTFAGEAQTLRRADSHPDAPPRKPLSAVLELGTPFLEVRAQTAEPTRPEPEDAHFEPVVEAPAPIPVEMPEERPLPTDLDIPLVAYDPVAMFSRHNRPAPAPKPPLAPRERLEVFELTPMVRAPEEPALTPPASTASIRNLLDRLETSVAKRDAELAAKRPAESKESIRDTLDTLRTLATR